MPSRAIKAAGTRWPTCASCIDGAIIGITNGWDTKQQRLEPDAEQSARPVLRGRPTAMPRRLPDFVYGRTRLGPPGAHGRQTQRRRSPAEWRIVVKDRYPA